MYRSTVVPEELVKPPVSTAAWTNSGLEGDRVTDLCGTARFGGQVCPREVWLHVQTVSCDDGRLDPAQDRDQTSVFRT